MLWGGRQNPSAWSAPTARRFDRGTANLMRAAHASCTRFRSRREGRERKGNDPAGVLHAPVQPGHSSRTQAQALLPTPSRERTDTDLRIPKPSRHMPSAKTLVLAAPSTSRDVEGPSHPSEAGSRSIDLYRPGQSRRSMKRSAVATPGLRRGPKMENGEKAAGERRSRRRRTRLVFSASCPPGGRGRCRRRS